MFSSLTLLKDGNAFFINYAWYWFGSATRAQSRILDISFSAGALHPLKENNIIGGNQYAKYCITEPVRWQALIHGWSKKKSLPHNMFIIKSSARLACYDEFGVSLLPNKEFLKEADLIILAMKPKDIHTAMADIGEYILPDTAVLSVLAGISIETIAQGLGNRPIARTMPNTSATIGMSASGIAFNDYVSDIQKALYIQMLEAIGTVIEVEEDQLHAVTALSGSGPAYIYYLVEAFEQVGTELGLPQDVVRTLMVQTLAGTAAMLQQTPEEPMTLRRKVTSPGGTTEAGIQALEQFQFKSCLCLCSSGSLSFT